MTICVGLHFFEVGFGSENLHLGRLWIPKMQMQGLMPMLSGSTLLKDRFGGWVGFPFVQNVSGMAI